MPSIRRLALAATVASVLIGPSVADADTYCVNHPACVEAGGTPESLKLALSAANADPDPSTVMLGEGTWATIGRDVEEGTTLVGSGAATTLIPVVPDGTRALLVRGRRAVVRDLRISGPGTESEGLLELRDGGQARDVKVTLSGDDVDQHLAVRSDNGTLTDVDVDAGELGIAIHATAETTLRRVRAQGMTALTVQSSSTDPEHRSFVVDDSHLKGRFFAAEVGFGSVLIADTVLETTGSINSAALFAHPDAGAQDGGSAIDLIGVTIAPGAPGAEGIIAAGTPARPADVSVTDSIIDPLTSVAVRRAGTASVDLTRVNRPGKVVQTGSAGTFTETGRVVGTPAYVDRAAADFTLVPGSPLIDAGGAADTSTDRLGRARSTDGDGDCAAARDLGAFEAPALANPACGASGVPAGDGAVTPPGGPPAPAGTLAPARSSAPSRTDRTAPLLSRLSLRRVGRTLRGTVRSSETARISLQVERLSGRKVGGATIVRVPRAGTAALRLTLPASLGRGRYRLAITATDAAGNRAKAIRRGFRVR